MSTVTMQELELESAELLPARETLNCYSGARTTAAPASATSTATRSRWSWSTFGNSFKRQRQRLRLC